MKALSLFVMFVCAVAIVGFSAMGSFAEVVNIDDMASAANEGWKASVFGLVASAVGYYFS